MHDSHALSVASVIFGMRYLLALAIAIFAPAILAQSPKPKFEVASIRPCEDGASDARIANGNGGPSPGRLDLRCQSLKALIDRAYINFADGHEHVWAPQVAIEGGPSWIDSDRYRIEAKPENPQSRGTMNGPMLQALLEDRFKLRLHRQIREIPVYALTVAKGGPKLRPYQEGSCVPLDFDNLNLAPPPKPGQPDPPFCGMSEVTATGYSLYRTTIADFATEFSARLDRPVIDKTGIAGVFNIHLDLSATDLGYPDRDSAAPGAPVDPSAVFDAVRIAVQKLGLRLDPAKGPGQFLLIDSAEKPSGN
jgi:uncharacterized protein (TIGR03435 family)